MYGLEGDGLLKKVVPVAVDETAILAGKVKTTQDMGTVIVDNYLDKVAHSKGYTNIISARSFAGVDNPFRAESEKFIAFSGACWKISGDVLATVAAGGEVPTPEEFLGMLPDFETFTVTV